MSICNFRYSMSQLKPFLFLVPIFLTGAACQNYSVTPITTSSGLYYEKIGEVLLSNSNWQFVTSVDYEAYLLFYEYLFQKAEEIHTFCQTFNLSTCFERWERFLHFYVQGESNSILTSGILEIRCGI